MSKEEGDRICADVLRLVRMIHRERCVEPVRDRVLRDPSHDLTVYGEVVPSERGS